MVLKLVCENVMLNLFIGMILDNFGFIMDDVGLSKFEDDYQWTNGSTSDQVKVITKTFQKHDGGTGYLPICALHSFLTEIHLPLGYRDSEGGLHFGDAERVTELLIRAELNVHVLDMNKAFRDAAQRGWKRLVCLSLSFCVAGRGLSVCLSLSLCLCISLLWGG